MAVGSGTREWSFHGFALGKVASALNVHMKRRMRRTILHSSGGSEAFEEWTVDSAHYRL